jgi:hypothetical protein
MGWSDATPWKRRQEDDQRRLAEAERVVGAMRSGAMPFRAGWPLLIDIARGEAGRVVRIGKTHEPDMKTEETK